MQKIRVAQDEAVEAQWPATVVMRVEVRTTSGERQRFEVVNPLGHEQNPMGDQHIEAKFERLAGPRYGAAVSRQILTRWRQVDRLAALGEALDLLTFPADPGR
jgi:2-methylcitrate dehydratase PrpD